MGKINIKGTSADAILLAGIKLVTAALGLAITRLLSEYLPIREYGTYSQIMLLISTISSVTIFGMMDGVSYFFHREQDIQLRDSYIATIFALQGILSGVTGTAVMLLTQPLCRYFENPDIAPLLIFAAVLPFLQNIMSMSQALFVAAGKARLLAFRNLAISLIRLAAAMIVVLAVRSALVVLITSLILDIGQIAFFWIVLRKNGYRLRLKKVKPILVGNILIYCAPMAIFIIINTLNRDLDKYIISMMTDAETLALYTNASKQLPFDILVTSFITVLVPHIAHCIAGEKREQAADLYKNFLEIAYISVGVLCCAALTVAPQLMKLLYSNKYTDGLAIFCVYIGVDLLRFTNITLVLSAVGKTKQLMCLGLGSLVLNGILNIVLYKLLGVVGPALATLIVTMLSGVLILRLSANVLNEKLMGLFDKRYMVQFVKENVLLMISLSCLRHILDYRDVHYFVILLIVAGMYVGIMALLNGKRLLRALRNVNAFAEKEDE